MIRLISIYVKRGGREAEQGTGRSAAEGPLEGQHPLALGELPRAHHVHDGLLLVGSERRAGDRDHALLSVNIEHPPGPEVSGGAAPTSATRTTQVPPAGIMTSSRPPPCACEVSSRPRTGRSGRMTVHRSEERRVGKECR